MSYIPESPTDENQKIEAIVSFSRGFIVASKGYIYAYEKTEDPRFPYRRIGEPIEVKMEQNNAVVLSD